MSVQNPLRRAPLRVRVGAGFALAFIVIGLLGVLALALGIIGGENVLMLALAYAVGAVSIMLLTALTMALKAV